MKISKEDWLSGTFDLCKFCSLITVCEDKKQSVAIGLRRVLSCPEFLPGEEKEIVYGQLDMFESEVW
jgi:hypothetical protein